VNETTDTTLKLRTLELPVEPITAAAFAPYGTLVEAAEDGKLFGPDEAQLELSRGTPRFYILRLKRRDLGFRNITRHMQVTQMLASVGGKSWLMAVAPPDAPDDPDAVCDLARLKAFRIPGDVGICLHRSTWHAGPFFEEPTADFFNLELADTNQVDHHNCYLDKAFGVIARFKV
jgi:ureidoglycolate hydrolase